MKSLIQVSDIVCMLKKVFFLLHWEIRKAFSWGRKKGWRDENRGEGRKGARWNVERKKGGGGGTE